MMMKVWYICYEGEGKGEDKTNPLEDTPKGDDKITFDAKQQEFFNKKMAEAKRQHQDELKKVMNEMEALRKKSNLTEEERDEYETRLDELRKKAMSEKEIIADEASKAQKQYEEELSKSNKERDSWKEKYTSSTIVRALTDAAVVNKAYSPEQIVAILQSSTRLAEVLDADGKPTGKLAPVVDYNTLDKDKKPVTLELSVTKAVEKMKEEEKYLNLFIAEGTGGIGRHNVQGGSSVPELSEVSQKSFEEYEKLRREGKLDKDLGRFKK